MTIRASLLRFFGSTNRWGGLVDSVLNWTFAAVDSGALVSVAAFAVFVDGLPRVFIFSKILDSKTYCGVDVLVLRMLTMHKLK